MAKTRRRNRIQELLATLLGRAGAFYELQRRELQLLRRQAEGLIAGKAAVPKK
ncbi:MAG: hypothetical protein L0Z62_36615 [Gemmataceae bacterium]|nr:hypothetical protein [Gemmataceae bacterium]